MSQQPSDLERCLSELQAQIDGLGAELRLTREGEGESQAPERRLTELTDQWGGLLDRWAITGERHGRVLGELEARLSQWNDIEAHLHEDAAHRFRDLEQTITREWDSLRRLHEEPVRQLQEQANALAEVSVAAAESAQRELERAEARLATLETELHRRMTELSRNVQTAVARGQLESVPSLPAANAGSSSTPAAAPGGPSTVAVEHPAPREDVIDDIGRALASKPSEIAVLSTRVDSLERALADGQSEVKEAAERASQISRHWRTAAAALAIATIATAVLGLWLQRQVGSMNERVAEAERQARAANEAPAPSGPPPGDDAARLLAETRDAAAKAQIVGNVLAAPDLIRYRLVAAQQGGRAAGQLLWSRSRGLVFSGTRLDAVPATSVYQVWLLTRVEAVSAGVVTPDASGRVAIATDQPPAVPRPVIGVSVTLELGVGGERPSSDLILTYQQQ